MKRNYFEPALFDFLSDLKQNNNREWFHANKHIYESKVKQPMLEMIADFGPHLHKIHPAFVADPRPVGGSMFRIYRDVRFSQDKSPYKTQASAHFQHHKAGKHAHVPGFYLHLEPGQCFTAAGVWHPDSPTLTAIRKEIVNHPEDWKKATRRLSIEGDKLTRPPKGFAADHPFIEDLKRKDFVTVETLSQKQICSAGFINDLASSFKSMLPLVLFLSKALRLPV